MKKLFFAAYTIALVALAPVVFIGYLHGTNQPIATEKKVKVEEVVGASADIESAYPASLFIAIR